MVGIEMLSSCWSDGDIVIVECIGNLFRVCVGSVLVEGGRENGRGRA